jgi:small-conductance mechanosensitive channel
MGLAAKEVVSNFFGGAVLLITQPFVIGDRIKVRNNCHPVVPFYLIR